MPSLPASLPSSLPSDSPPLLHWTEGDAQHSAIWRSGSDSPPPKKLAVADDSITADLAFRLACEGTGLLWRGDYHNARQLLAAIERRVDRSARTLPPELPLAFHLHRQARGHRARILGMLLVPLDADYGVPLRRAPELRAALDAAFGPSDAPSVIPLTELLGVVGAYQWRVRGVYVPALAARVHPHYGVFAPIRGEYVDLVAQAPLPPAQLAFDIGTGTGVLAAVLARRGVPRVVATESEPRALRCAEDNLRRLGLLDTVELATAPLFPPGRADLVLCNPPWLPARATTTLERAVYDPDSRMLRAFLSGLEDHLEPGGEGWLILSDLAEHLGLRAPGDVQGWIDAAGLALIDRLETRPAHRKANDPKDPLHGPRAKERTSLWRLRVA